MTQYLLSVIVSDEELARFSEEETQQIYAATGAFNDKLQQAGAWVFAGGLHPASTATVVRSTGGEVVMTDGPFAETKEYIGGLWIIEAKDLDEALAWAGEGSAACGAKVEVRPFQDED